MDIGLARTFLEVVASGSFVTAADRLHLTQTAVSARVRVLEQQLGRRLFVRNRAGARLTAAGDRFVRHATALVQVWERARQQVALPAGRAEVVSVGGELSLWDPLLADWLVWMRRHCADIALRTEVDAPGRLLDRVQEGSLDLAVLHSPPTRSDLVVELLVEETLVMVTTAADGTWRTDDYVLVDWGSAFMASHRAAYPELANPPVSITLGPLALAYLLTVGGAGYFRASAVRQHLADGRLQRVRRAPEFSHSVYAVYSTRGDAEVLGRVRDGLRVCARPAGPRRRRGTA
ncbi:LysR family transcriptional regulator [Vineibacter terrae]|uniref:LysR family transcriptional regulator n=1 Tax=Vineibacter terrae TaxID=2586908 RepID=A0A5C8PPX5_9HYPH|nr:LysR family transcriptional regulator [Vineibacter terrae]TXL76773.1 LysR family transcriptional regulator [Vineibacter terrae]